MRIPITHCPVDDLRPIDQEVAQALIGEYEVACETEASGAAALLTRVAYELPEDIRYAARGCIIRKQLGLCVRTCVNE